MIDPELRKELATALSSRSSGPRVVTIVMACSFGVLVGGFAGAYLQSQALSEQDLRYSLRRAIELRAGCQGVSPDQPRFEAERRLGKSLDVATQGELVVALDFTFDRLDVVGCREAR